MVNPIIPVRWKIIYDTTDMELRLTEIITKKRGFF